MNKDNYVEEMKKQDANLHKHVADVTVVDSTDPDNVQLVHGEAVDEEDDEETSE